MSSIMAACSCFIGLFFGHLLLETRNDTPERLRQVVSLSIMLGFAGIYKYFFYTLENDFPFQFVYKVIV